MDVGDSLGPYIEHQGIDQGDVVLVAWLTGHLWKWEEVRR